MSGTGAGLEITMTGPLFDGRAEYEMVVIGDAILDRVSQLAADRVRDVFHQHVRHPKGFYQNQIIIDRKATSRVVNDSRAKYGNWLEGTSRRNETTRFKGYSHFRSTVAYLATSNDVTEAGDQVVREHLGGLE